MLVQKQHPCVGAVGSGGEPLQKNHLKKIIFLKYEWGPQLELLYVKGVVVTRNLVQALNWAIPFTVCHIFVMLTSNINYSVFYLAKTLFNTNFDN